MQRPGTEAITISHISVTEAARRLEVSARTVRRLCATGAIPCDRVGRAYLIRQAELPDRRAIIQRDHRHA
ncbi:MAG: DNA-binding protein [Caulobacteraceae bacterium]|nr:DNA-binding protein [Caulobacteraceae bacterium]